ncbi:Transcription regulator [Leucobacter sp. 7(1)]|nr:Transcription regulator [Leucobacter sp. 7(1)]
MSADDLADSAGVSRQTIFNISSGKHYGDLNTWLKISRALGVGLDELLADVWGDSGHGTRVG